MRVARFVVAVVVGAVFSIGVAMSPAFAAGSARQSLAAASAAPSHLTLGQQVAAAKPGCYYG